MPWQSCQSSHLSSPRILLPPSMESRTEFQARDVEKNADPASSASDSTLEEKGSHQHPVKEHALPSAAGAGAELPEGGLYAWATVVGAWLVQFVNFGYVNAFGAYQDYYVRHYLTQSSPSVIGWIGGVQICFTFAMGIVTGRLFDAGYFYYLNISSLVLYALSSEAFSFEVFLSHGIAFGLASGLSYLPSLAIVGHYFKRRRPLAVGIVSTGSALGEREYSGRKGSYPMRSSGAIIQPIMLNNLFNNQDIGFHNGVRISGAFNVFLLIVANGIMRTRLPPNRSGQSLPVKQYSRDLPYVIILISCMFAFLGLFYVVFYLQLYSVVHGIDDNLAFYSLSILNAASILGRVIPGYLAPKFGPLNMSIFFWIANGTITACLPLVNGRAGTAIYAIVYGFVSGGCIGLTPAIMLAFMTDPREYGTRLGIFFFFGGAIGLVATPISGALLTDQYNWVRASVFCGVFCIAAGFGYLISRTMIVKKKGIPVL
ncbi:hypothetical protein NP233_g2654 [Leucocoprinus birnbaumii]|uniref:Major facilitator superfamily (MFS) profile domain-containing protein n=1 Tax=Leucocoprinus birnbaumii TaxID=56174 RepID=A0AAD5VXW8_9AGAR|nr:hypothetical protein NP233_g2654 [Leucocoprinus birnbaumii]